MTREIDSSQWRVSSYNAFDGKAEDCFGSTSLHLSFTNYHVPSFSESRTHGQQDTEISLLESVISIRDSGNWIADVDILRALEGGRICKMPPLPFSDDPKNSAPENPIISVGCWKDVLDFPDDIVVVKAQNNWVARLAIAAVSVGNRRKIERITICPNSVCRRCVKREFPENIYVY